jgi:hypothetical protein
MSLIETEEAVAEMNFGSNSGTTRKHGLAEGWFSP